MNSLFSKYPSSLMVGFEPLFKQLERLTESVQNESYPPFDIEDLGLDAEQNHWYQIVIAIAGFQPDELDVSTHADGVLTVNGRVHKDEARTYLHRGISRRKFTRSFQLADHTEIDNATYENGLLVIKLVRRAIEPDTVEKRIPIQIGTGR